ncbi:MAG: globin [Anaerolineae bacterium]|jgi:hemoglobin|nr:globin [Anaerolineae bacterium]
MTDPDHTLYDLVGGDAFFRDLVRRFYDYVEQDPELRPMFPDDLAPGREWQYLFLAQFFGGPARYIAQRGHPRLRMRHMPFPINKAAQERWLTHMLTALDELHPPEPAYTEMREYFIRGSLFLVNQIDPDTPEDTPS